MNRTDSIKELAGALCKARANFKTFGRDKTVLVKTKSGGSYSFSYAPLESILEAVVPALLTQGLTLLQEVLDGRVATTLIHTSGEWITSGGTPIKVTAEDAQAFGSGMTYARRYDLTLFLGLSADDDDDANAASGNEVSKAAFKKPHSPSDGAMESLPPEKQQEARDVAMEVIGFMEKGKILEAAKWIKAANFEAEAEIAMWALLPSGMRAALKKHQAGARAFENDPR